MPSKQDFEAFQASHGNALPAIFGQIMDSNNISAVVNGVPGAQQNNDARKNRAQQSYNEMNQYNDMIKNIVKAIEKEHATISNSVKAMKARVYKIKQELNEKTDLAKLRKEQASDVSNKAESGFHSSMLGLWKPLHPQSRSVLYTVSVVFSLIGIAAVLFLVMTRTSPARTSITNTRGAGSAFEQSSLLNDVNNYGRVAGGSMKLRPKK